MSDASDFISDLLEIDTLKTWSLIVTLFGDLESDRISGAQIRTLLGHTGIKPEAIRVALHRLKNDGWVNVEKEGRDAYYSLSRLGSQETANAAGDVYRMTPKYDEPPQFALTPPGSQIETLPEVWKGVVLVPAGQKLPPQHYALSVSNGIVPDWLEQAIVSAKVLQSADRLSRVVKRINVSDHEVSSEHKQVLRLLVLHFWRRIALRAESWLHMALIPDGAIANCHRPVSIFLGNTESIKVS